MIRFGKAGWQYRDWQGIVYRKPQPRGFDPLSYLAGFFDVVGRNYKEWFPSKQMFANATTFYIASSNWTLGSIASERFPRRRGTRMSWPTTTISITPPPNSSKRIPISES
jgi:hypothetical protein